MTLPLRQKILLFIAISVGLFILLVNQFQILEQNKLTMAIFIYSIGIPFGLLMFDTLIDLNDNRIFMMWLSIAILLFIFYTLTRHNVNFQIQRSHNFNSSGINILLSDISTSSLKTPLMFLLTYWVCNSIMKKITGNFILNTYRQISWRHDLVGRKVNWLDVLFNIILCLVIVISGLTR